MTDDTAIADPTIGERELAVAAVATGSAELMKVDVRYAGAVHAAMAGCDAVLVARRPVGKAFQRIVDDSTPRRRRLGAA